MTSKSTAPSATISTASPTGDVREHQFSEETNDCNPGEKCSIADQLKRKIGDDFFGRSEELGIMRKVTRHVVNSSIYGTTTTATTTTTLDLLPTVLVWGVSGTGKSHLIQHFLKETKQQSACYILQGKYDEYTGSSDPFSALAQALKDFSSQLKNGPVEELERIRKCIKAAFGNDDNTVDADAGAENISELAALISVVPSLSILAPSPSVESTMPSSLRSTLPQMESNQQGVNESVWNRLQYIFLHFIKTISTKERPVYLFLDDLQWSSVVALELLANLVSDPELDNFLFLGSIRQETNTHNDEVLEVAKDSPLHASFLSRLHQSQNKELTQITTQNLSLHDTVHFISSLLDDHPVDDDLKNLAQKIHAKTRGNIFFTTQLLEELQRNNVLVHNQTSFQREWNIDSIKDDISISDNIVNVIESKLKQLPVNLQAVLSMAAYVGATFDVSTLLHVIRNEQRNAGASPFFTATTDINKEYLTTLLEKAVLEQLLSNPIGGSKYRFTHDRIQQAAHGMIPYGEVRDMLRLRIGHCLLGLYREGHQHHQSHQPDNLPGPTENVHSTHQSSGGTAGASSSSSESDRDHGLLFVAADHLNSVPTKDHMLSVMLNLNVSEQAMHMAALASAAVYLQKAADQLKSIPDPWEYHYDITLRLYRARCDVELSLGHFQLGHRLGDEVLAKAKTLDEKLSTYLSLAHALGRQGKHVESINLCLRATIQLRVFPKRMYLAHIAKGMLKIRSFLKRNDNDAIMQLPLMTDRRKLMSMKLLAELVARASLTQNLMLWLLGMCQHIQHSVKFGLCEDSAMTFASYGILSGASGDQAMAMRCAGLGKRIIAKTKGKAMAGWVSYAIAAFIIPYESSTTDVIQEHRRGYKSSMEAGEFELGFLNWLVCILMAYLAGYELQPLMQATETTLQQYTMYRVESLCTMAAENLSMMQMMAGKKSIDWREIEESANRNIRNEKLDPSELFLLGSYFYCRMALATYFGRYDLGTKLAASFHHVTAEDKSCVTNILKDIFTGINAAGRYRETGKRRHLRMLNKVLSKMGAVTKTRGSKFIHHTLMLNAELASIRKQNKSSRSVHKAYDLAIMVASEASFVQDAALTCELAGEHCIRQGCSMAETSAYFVKAVGFYADWGCIVKVDDLKRRRSEYLTRLEENRMVENTTAPGGGSGGGMVLFGNNHCSSRGALVENMLSSYMPAIPTIGSSMVDSSTPGLQEQIVEEEDDGNLSLLTDGSR